MNTGINSEEDEILTGRLCPKCSYPTVEEFGLEVCYHCGWSEEDEMVEEYFQMREQNDTNI